MRHLSLRPKRRLSTFRRVALSSWKTVGDPSVYGSLTLHVDKALAYLEEFREVTGLRLTMTHLVGKALAGVIEEMPDANAVLRWGKIYLREDINLFFHVAMRDPDNEEIDLSGTVIQHTNRKSLAEIVQELNQNVSKVRKSEDEELRRSRNLVQKLPQWMIRPFLNLTSFLVYGLNLNMRWAGLPDDPFGSVALTNIGALGLEEGYVPLVPYTRIPLFVAMGAVHQGPIVENGELKVGHVLKLMATFDHRILDGSHAAIMAKVLKRYFEDPWQHFGEPKALV